MVREDRHPVSIAQVGRRIKPHLRSSEPHASTFPGPCPGYPARCRAPKILENGPIGLGSVLNIPHLLYLDSQWGISGGGQNALEAFGEDDFK